MFSCITSHQARREKWGCVWGGVLLLVTAQSPSEATSLQKHCVPATYLCLRVLAVQSPARI